MDFIEIESELREVSEQQRELCKRYAAARREFGEAAWAVNLLLVPHQKDAAYRKASFEKQILMLLAETAEHHKQEVYGIVKQMKLSQEHFKGLEKIIDQRAGRISSLQSLMRYARDNGG